MAGAAAVTAYDINPVAAVAIRMNAAANGVMILAVCADVLDQDDLQPLTPTWSWLRRFLRTGSGRRVTKLAERGHARGAAVLRRDFGPGISAAYRLIQLTSYDIPASAC